MAKEVTRFTADDGTEHTTEFEAWKADFKNWLITNGADNEAIAAKIVKTVDDSRPESLTSLFVIVNGLISCAPDVVRAEISPAMQAIRDSLPVDHQPV